MPVHVNNIHIFKFLSGKELHHEIKLLAQNGHLPNERTLQAYIWNYLRECISKKGKNDEPLFYPDYIFFIEKFEEGMYPDLSLKEINTLETTFVIELKHHYNEYIVNEQMYEGMTKDIEKINNFSCPGIFIFTCPSKIQYEKSLSSLNNLAQSNTSIIIIECD